MSSTPNKDAPKNRNNSESGSPELRIRQRKLNSLKAGVHRIDDTTKLVGGVHVIGVGGAGVKVIERFMREAPDDLLSVQGSRLTVLAVDIGDADLNGVRQLAGRYDDRPAQIDIVSLEEPKREMLEATLARYDEFLTLESPFYLRNPDSKGWLPKSPVERNFNGSLSRSIAKAVYGRAYYDCERPMHKMLKRFAESVEKTGDISVVCIVFGLAGGTGGGMAIDLARHLSNGIFGRRVLVAGIGIMPHPDETRTEPSNVHTTLSELDVLLDETKNSGVTVSCGDQYKNPFTAGFLAVQQLPCVSIDKSREIIEAGLASLLSERRGANLWETLRLLNWVAAPPTQHPAARTPWGNRWVHMLAFIDERDINVGVDVRKVLGLTDGCVPEMIELRTHATIEDDIAEAWKCKLDESLTPSLPTQSVKGRSTKHLVLLLPRLSRRDLVLTKIARNGYLAQPKDRKRANHALLLEQGIYLCEPSTSREGMAGANIGAGHQWISVPISEVNCDA